jgi:hypothetical protein
VPKKLNFFLIKYNSVCVLIIYNSVFYITLKIKTIDYYKKSRLLLLNNLYFQDNITLKF